FEPDARAARRTARFPGLERAAGALALPVSLLRGQLHHARAGRPGPRDRRSIATATDRPRGARGNLPQRNRSPDVGTTVADVPAGSRPRSLCRSTVDALDRRLHPRKADGRIAQRARNRRHATGAIGNRVVAATPALAAQSAARHTLAAADRGTGAGPRLRRRGQISRTVRNRAMVVYRGRHLVRFAGGI